MTLMVICSSPVQAEYSYQLILPPGAENANAFGINNAGKVVGGVFDDFGFLYSFEYDMKNGLYTPINEEFDVIEISNPGVMVGSGGSFYDVCTIRDKVGNLTYFYPPSSTENSFCASRGVNSNGKVSGFIADEFDVFTGFIYDSRHGTFEEFLPSPRTIAHGINAQGQNVGTVYLFAEEAYPGSPEGRYGYLREPDGSTRYFEVSPSYPGQTNIRGISENGLISGFYLNADGSDFRGFATTIPDGSGFATISLADDEVLHVSPCAPGLPLPPDGYVLLTDVFTSQIRNDGVVVGQCTDYHINWTTGDWIVYATYGLIATPVK